MRQNKSYKTYREMQMRESIFQNNDNEIWEMNEASKRSGRPNAATYKHNFSSDLTQVEFEAIYTGARPEAAEDNGEDEVEDNDEGDRDL